MRTVYEILKEVGLDHKDAVMIDFAYASLVNGFPMEGLAALSNRAADLLSRQVGLAGCNGCKFWTYKDLQIKLEEKFPEGAPIHYTVTLTKALGDTIEKCLIKLMNTTVCGAENYEEVCTTRFSFKTVWEEREIA